MGAAVGTLFWARDTYFSSEELEVIFWIMGTG